MPNVPSVIEWVSGLPVRLREPHDLSWLNELGTVFAVLDEQDSGNLCFGVDTGEQRLFVKYAGADPTLRLVAIDDSVAALRRGAGVHEALGGGLLAPVLDAFDVGDHGFALVLPWVDAVPLGRQYGQVDRVRSHPLPRRISWVQQAIDFHVEVAALGWVAIDFYDGSVMVTDDGDLVLCDLDLYRPGPVTNWMGRMYGSTRFMSPEEFTLGAALDEITTEVAMGAFAHSLLGDAVTKAREAWQAGDALFAVAARATSDAREKRYPSMQALSQAWREASEIARSAALA